MLGCRMAVDTGQNIVWRVLKSQQNLHAGLHLYVHGFIGQHGRVHGLFVHQLQAVTC